MLKPKVSAQLMSQTGLGRPGAMASRGSKPVQSSKGSKFAALQNALLKRGVQTPSLAKKVSAGKPGRQFFVKAAGGDSALGTPKSDSTPKPAMGWTMRTMQKKQHPGV